MLRDRTMAVLLIALALLGALAMNMDTTAQTQNLVSPKEEQNSKAILDIFRTIEQRDDTQTPKLFQPDFEIRWPPSLPYGGSFRGLEPRPNGWNATWDPLQPTEAERRMNARVIAAHDDDVVFLWHQRGLSPNGTHFDEEVLGYYTFRESKLARAQMFYFDTAAVT